MSYTIEMITKADQRTSVWSGGTTTELSIYPGNAEYSKRNFSWRLSSARVETEESTFTSLPGVWRYIMVIEGEMYLEHESHHSIHLGPNEKDSFSGSWTTKSKGRVRDFNLMVTNGYKGEIQGLNIIDVINFENISLYDSCEYITQAFYCTEGKVKIEIDDTDKITIDEGDIALINIKGKLVNIKIYNLQDNLSRVINAIIYK